MKDSILRTKSYAFALRIIKLYQYIAKEHKEYELSRQILKCGTSVGGLIKEGVYAESKADLIHKLGISLKEAGETEYWFGLLADSGYIEPKLFRSFNRDCIELIKLLTATIKTLKGLK